jgi:hypothetical protein
MGYESCIVTVKKHVTHHCLRSQSSTLSFRRVLNPVPTCIMRRVLRQISCPSFLQLLIDIEDAEISC